MGIIMAGTDHTLADVDIRSGFSFTKKQMSEALRQLKNTPGISGAVIINTCGRTEVWADVRGISGEDLSRGFCRLKGISEDKYLGSVTSREDSEAVDHLFHLAAGLRSPVIAEDQILTQVGEAIAFSRENYAADNVLEVLFRDALKSAKRVKSEVSFDRSDRTAADRAIARLRDMGLDIRGTKCLVIGNGRMGRVTSQALLDAGALVTVTVREYHSGIVDIPRGCSRINYSERYSVLKDFPVVFSATASPNYTLTPQKVMSASPLPGTFFIDLAVPRDIDPACSGLSGIRLYNIDDLGTDEISLSMRSSLREAESIIRQEEEKFYSWYNGKDLIPLISEIKDNAANDLELRLQKKIKRLPIDNSLQEDLIRSIKTSMGKVTAKLIFGMRDNLDKDTFIECVEALRLIYDDERQS